MPASVDLAEAGFFIARMSSPLTQSQEIMN